MDTNRELLMQVNRIAEPLCASEGMELVFVEYRPEKDGLILRIYIDKPGGVALSDCVVVSRQLNDLLDVHLEGEHAYRLEVSSPGTDRPLGKPEDFKRFAGKRIKIKTRAPLDGRRHFTGVLQGLEGGRVTIKLDKIIMSIPYDSISKARLSNHDGDNPC